MGSSTRLRVAVIGAGAAGLAALRHLSAYPKKFLPVAFEMTPYITGTWVYTDRLGTDEMGLPLHSSMYKNLRTNLPKEVMAFPGFPFPKSVPSFVTHQEVRQYLEDYAEHYQLLKYIQFNKKVDHVKPLMSETGEQTWSVDVQDVTCTEAEKENHHFDAILVCNGHYAVPFIPDLPGLANFNGQVVHSHDYREPNVFSGKEVIILGAAASGPDISVEISSCAEQVYLSHKHDRLQSMLPTNVSQVPGIKEVRLTTVILENDEEIHVDVILLCTGYLYDFPFLDPQCKPEIEDQRIKNLYKHIIDVRHPTLSFIGICKLICPFPLFECQVRFVLAALAGEMVLPSAEDMEKDIRDDFVWRLSQGMPTRYAHKMGTLQWGYNDMLAELAGFQPICIPKVVKTLYDHVHATRAKNVVSYKRKNFEILSDTDFKEINLS